MAGLRKSYGPVAAVRGVSFTVHRGEIFALLGPNGAGKTTILEILEGFRTRDAGQVDVLGADPGDRASGRALRERIGLVLQDIAVEPYLTVRETVARNAGYYPAPRDVGEVIALVGLAGQERQKVRNLSGGQKRRLDLALGLVGSPELLFLDEPTTGFDPAARREAWDVVRGLRSAGHHGRAHHALHGRSPGAGRPGGGDRPAGQVVAEGTPAAIGGRDRARARIRFALPDGCRAGRPAARRGPGRPTAWSPSRPRTRPRRCTGSPAGRCGRGTVLAGLTVDRPSLEDIYLRLTEAAGPSENSERSR